MIIPIFYELILWLLALLALPKIIYSAIFYGKYRESFFKRWGKGFPVINKGNRRLIWVHAVSMGETKAVSTLIKSLKAGKDNPIVLVSSITETAHAEAKKSIPEADYHVFMPFDFNFLIAPIVAKVSPDLVLLSETDFWFNFLRAAKKCGAEIAVVNGKISERSVKRFQKFSFFSNALFGCIDLFCLQSVHYQKRFASLNIPSDKMIVTGNLKFDDEPPRLTEIEKLNLKVKWGIDPSSKVLVIGSSHDPEERQLLEVMRNIWKKEPSLKVILVPRHPDRFNTVGTLLESLSIPFSRYSQPEGLSNINSKVILIDAMGQLRNSYQIADLAIVAGSYTEKVGGHNILEPLWFGVPTIFGPHMHS
ncbi:MAG: 3-deoxy-D-manno-octulosonic acid transferase, partial [Parachlamydiaceae bacterium]|nr:3-deoxy-D-manno-octulosonic acid transferase [Parachlamydiaceae bacterium]